jgi:hypothetical protein
MRKSAKFFGIIFLSVLFGVLAMSTVFAADAAITGKVGSQGIGGDIVKDFAPNFNGRLNVNWYNYTLNDFTTNSVAMDIKLQLLTFGALVDWFPMDNGFRLAAGAYINMNKITAQDKLAAATAVTVNGTLYPAVTDLSLDVAFNTLAPYIGLGYGNPMNSGSAWTFSLDLGLMYQGDPKVTFASTDAVFVGTTAIADLNAETAVRIDANNDSQWLKWYPVVAVGVSYAF